MSKNVENIEAVETAEVEETKESKIKTVASKVGAGFKKHWKKVAVGAAAGAVGLICYAQKRKADHDYEDLDIEEDDTVDATDDIDLISE